MSIPIEDLARKFVRQVSERDRSRYLAEILARSLADEEDELVRACRLANKDAGSRPTEEEWGSVQNPVEETWNDSAPR